MTWEFVTYGNAELLTLVFNGIAMIFGDADVWGAMRVVAMASFVAWMFQVALNKGDLNPKWILTFIIVMSVGLIPKNDVYLEDKIFPSNNTVVSNIPIGLAAPASFLNYAGNWLAESIEVVFSLPNGNNYTDGGMLWANRMMKAALEHRVSDPSTAGNLARFAESCIVMDLALGRYGLEDLTASKDLSTFFKSSSSILYVDYLNPATGNKSLTSCKDAWSNIVARLDANVDAELGMIGRLLNKDENTTAEVLARVKTSLPVGLKYLSGASKTESEILKQTMILNSIETGLGSSFSNVSEAWVMAQAERERSLSQGALAKMGKNVLPLMRNVYEALLYAIFPIVAMMLMLPTAGKVALGYVKGLAWINLWIPLYALLHFVASYYNANAIQALPDVGSGISLLNKNTMYKELNEAAEMVGYMSLSIPLFAWMFLQQGGSLAAGLANRMVSSYESSVASSASNAAAGNFNAGNVSTDNMNSNKQDASIGNVHGFEQTQNELGTTKTALDGSSQTINMDSSSIGSKLSVASQVSDRVEANYSNATAVADNTSMDLSQSNAAVLDQARSYGDKLSHGEQVKDVVTDQGTTSFDKAVQEVDKLESKAAKELGLSNDDMDRAMAKIQAGIDFKSGESFWGGLAETMSGVSVKAGASVAGETASETRAREAFNSVQAFASSDQYTAAVKDVAQVTEGISAEKTDASSREFNTKIDSSVSKQDQFRESNSVAKNDVEQAQATRARAETMSATSDKDMTDQFLTYGVRSGEWDSKADAMDDLVKYRDYGYDDNNKVSNTMDAFIEQEVLPGLNSQADGNVQGMKDDGLINDRFEPKTQEELSARYERDSNSFEASGNAQVISAGIGGVDVVQVALNAGGGVASSDDLSTASDGVRAGVANVRGQGADAIEGAKGKINNTGDSIQETVKKEFLEEGVGGATDVEYAIDSTETREGNTNTLVNDGYLNTGVVNRSELFDMGNEFNTYGRDGADVVPYYRDDGWIDTEATSADLKAINNPDTVPELSRSGSEVSVDTTMKDAKSISEDESTYDNFSQKMKDNA